MSESISTSLVKIPKVAIIGNPNVGKSTIFNQLTGMTQKIGNYPGVTVDKKSGFMNYQGSKYQIIDLPGTYSLYPNSEDEIIAHRVLNELNEEARPDFVMMVIDSCQLSRGLFLATQLMDLGLNLALILNMTDVAVKKNIAIKSFEIFKALGVPILSTDARGAKGLDQIRELIHTQNFNKSAGFVTIEELIPIVTLEEVKAKFGLSNYYQAYQSLRFGLKDKTVSPADKAWIQDKLNETNLDLDAAQLEETKIRYRKITEILEKAVVKAPKIKEERGIDRILLHPVFGYLIFAGILLLIFQAIFAWATVPMDLIDGFFAELAGWVSNAIPDGPLSSLLTEGIIPGIGGIVIFIPQIAMLFGFLAILEDTGYMSRVVFLMDRWMRPFGLHGKSIVPLVSGVACAIPGVMAARNIGNWKEKIITIMVTPLMSCSARLPVYVILIGLVVPNDTVFGFVNLQAFALLSLYLLGVVGVLFTALLLKHILKTEEKSFLMVELPHYHTPRWKDVVITMYNKSKTFVTEAGKVILAISIILWVLASYGPPKRMDKIRAEGALKIEQTTDTEEIAVIQNETSSLLLENSFIGIMGKSIEPVIKPLGYDWKIGIALIASFAAREVFVSTIATIYSIGSDTEDELTIREKLNQQINPETGDKVYNTATAFSLMVFYAFAMQCMSTLAVVYRETKGWKWPLIQTVYMTALAYISALIVYQMLS